MTQVQSLELLFPVGRMVGGSCYTANTKDANGQPLVTKKGPNAGQPRVKYDMAVAFEKKGTTDWKQTEWGAKIYQLAAGTMPQQVVRPDFAFKIVDGDSQIPNKKGNKPCDRTGYPGHWVVYFSNGSAPKICNANGSAFLTEANAIKPGNCVQVLAFVKPNMDTGNPGVYISQSIVALSGYHPDGEISYTPDPASVGFGGALPTGASAVPVGATSLPVAPVTPVASVPPTSVAPATPGQVPPPNYAAVAVTPPAVPVVPAAPVGPQPTAKAAGASLEQMLAWPGWTQALLLEHGYIV